MAKLERGRWTGTVDVTLPDIDSVLLVRLHNVLFIKEVKKKTLVGKIGEELSQKLLTSWDDSYFSKSKLKSAKKIFIYIILLKVCVLKEKYNCC